MRLIVKLASDFLRDETGATSIEYALIVSSVSIVIVTTVIGIGSWLRDRFDALNGLLK